MIISLPLSNPPHPQDDTESHLAALYILQDLLAKHAPAFEEQFARLGLQLKIQALAGLPPTPDTVDTAMDTAPSGGETDGEKPGEKGDGGDEKTDGGSVPATTTTTTSELEDATELGTFTAYHWKEWSVVRSQDCLYLWNEFCSLELSSVSNGWFRFLLDNKLATMYSSGSTEGGPDSFGETCTAAVTYVAV